MIPDSISLEKLNDLQIEPDTFVDDKADRFAGEEPSVTELSYDIETAEENKKLKEELENLKAKILILEETHNEEQSQLSFNPQISSNESQPSLNPKATVF